MLAKLPTLCLLFATFCSVTAIACKISPSHGYCLQSYASWCLLLSTFCSVTSTACNVLQSDGYFAKFYRDMVIACKVTHVMATDCNVLQHIGYCLQRFAAWYLLLAMFNRTTVLACNVLQPHTTRYETSSHACSSQIFFTCIQCTHIFQPMQAFFLHFKHFNHSSTYPITTNSGILLAFLTLQSFSNLSYNNKFRHFLLHFLHFNHSSKYPITKNSGILVAFLTL